MKTLADRYYRDTHYPIPHADFLRLQHAHATGVLFLDLLDTLDLGGQRHDAVQQASFASVIALLTDQLGHHRQPGVSARAGQRGRLLADYPVRPGEVER